MSKKQALWHTGEIKNGNLPDGTLAIFGGERQPGFVGNVICAIAPPLSVTVLDVQRAERICEEHNALLGIADPASAIEGARKALEWMIPALERQFDSLFSIAPKEPATIEIKGRLENAKAALTYLTPAKEQKV